MMRDLTIGSVPFGFSVCVGFQCVHGRIGRARRVLSARRRLLWVSSDATVTMSTVTMQHNLHTNTQTAASFCDFQNH